MKSEVTFRYPHFDRSRFPLDVRKHKTTEILWEHCYFIGFRISVGHRYDYQHSLVLADGYQELQSGVSSEVEAILKRYPELYKSDITPIYIRNLQLLDNEFLSDGAKTEIREEIGDCLSKRDDTHFIVLGMFSKKQLGIIEMYTGDAMDAIRKAISKGSELYGNGHLTLEVRNSHPVNFEFDALVLQTAARLKALEDDESIGSRMHN